MREKLGFHHRSLAASEATLVSGERR
jgi:hypothetical protein